MTNMVFNMLFSALLFLADGLSADSGETGTIAGIVLDFESGEGIRYANVIVVGSNRGAMTDTDGRFLIKSVPPGIQMIKGLMMGYRSLEISDVVVEAGRTTDVILKLDKRWPDRNIPARSIVGIDVEVSSEELACFIEPTKEWFKIGEAPTFRVRIISLSDEDFYLVGAIDGSEDGARYPHASISIRPGDGLHRKSFARCGTLNGIGLSDFVRMRRDHSFEVFSHQFWPPTDERYASFVEPGTYTAIFRYSTNEVDYKNWAGSWSIPEAIEMLRRVPTVELACSTTFDVSYD